MISSYTEARSHNHKRNAHLSNEDLTSTQRYSWSNPEQHEKTEATCFQQADTNKLKLLLLTFNAFPDMCPEPLRSGKSLGQVKALASKEHLYLNDELPSSNRTEVHWLSEHARAYVLKLYGDDKRNDKIQRNKRFTFLMRRFWSSQIISIDEV